MHGPMSIKYIRFKLHVYIHTHPERVTCTKFELHFIRSNNATGDQTPERQINFVELPFSAYQQFQEHRLYIVETARQITDDR
jgi:hypothetical protein